MIFDISTTLLFYFLLKKSRQRVDMREKSADVNY